MKAFVRTWLPRLAAMCFSACVAIAGAELAVRLGERLAAPRLPKPGHRAVVDLGRLNYNDRQVAPSRPEGEFRVLSFGDSFGYSIMQPECSYCGRIEHYAGEATPGGRVRVVNLGEPATTVVHYRQAHAFWSKVFEHDAVLFHIYLGNDLLDIVHGYTPTDWTPNRVFIDAPRQLADGRPRRIPSKYPLRLMDFAYAAYAKRCLSEAPPTLPGPEFNAAAFDNLPEALFAETAAVQTKNFDPAQLDAMADGYRAVADFFRYVSEIRRGGKRVLVALGPNEWQVNPVFRDEVNRRHGLEDRSFDLRLSADVIAAIRDAIDPEVPLLDMVDSFRREYERRGVNLYYATNTHWGKEGNDLAGRLMASRIRQEWFGQPGILDEDLERTSRRGASSPAQLARARAYAARWVAESGPEQPSGRDGVVVGRKVEAGSRTN